MDIMYFFIFTLGAHMKKILLLIFAFTLSLYSDDIFIQKGHYNISYDDLTLPGDEKLGLLGTSYLYDFDSVYLGLGVYSAVSGRRGGFFTGGIEGGYRYNLAHNLSLDAGIFAGGGGGGSAPQGGGLMLRPHIGLLYSIYGYKLGLGYSKVKFPNGDIDSEQVFLQLSMPFEAIHKKNIDSPMILDDIKNFMKSSGKNMGWSDSYFAVTIQRYMIPSDVKNTSGNIVKKDMSLIGFEYGYDLSSNFFAFVQAAGAAGGGTDGYAEVLGGVGYKKPLGKHFGAYTRVSLGASGGGQVDTGGGIIHKESIGIYAKLNKKFSLGIEAGHIGAINGDFKATTLKFNFNYSLISLNVGKNLQSLESYQSFGDYEWNFELSNQYYMSDKNIRKNSNNSSLSLMGFKIDKYLDKRFYVSGQALGAYSGQSGGYAVGLVGLGVRVPMGTKMNLFAQMSAGVAGGGGVDTGNGMIYQPMIGIEYKISSSFGIQTSFGKVEAIDGNLDTMTIDVGFSYKFRTIN